MSSLPAFTPIGATASLAVTAVSGNVALNRLGANQVLVLNLGDAEAFIDFGDDTKTATTTDTPVPAGGWIMLSIPPAATHAAAITASGTATLRFTPGDGEFQGSAGAAGGGSSGNPSEVNLIQTGGNALVADDAAAGTTTPVPVGGIFETTLPTYTTADRVQAHFDSRGNLLARMQALGQTGADGFLNSSAAWVCDSANGAANARVLMTGQMAYNGASWDRVRTTGAVATTGGALLTELGPYVFGRVTVDGQVKGSAGFIHTITISPNGSVTAGVLTIYNSLTETGTVVAQFALPVTTFTPFSVTLDVACSTGIYVGFDATLANVSCTVSYR
jgi:hypothetical protein